MIGVVVAGGAIAGNDYVVNWFCARQCVHISRPQSEARYYYSNVKPDLPCDPKEC